MPKKKIHPSVEKLFAEDFKPLWMLREEAAVRQSLFEELQVRVDYEYRRNAYATLARIAKKWKRKQV